MVNKDFFGGYLGGGRSTSHDTYARGQRIERISNLPMLELCGMVDFWGSSSSPNWKYPGPLHWNCLGKVEVKPYTPKTLGHFTSKLSHTSWSLVCLGMFWRVTLCTSNLSTGISGWVHWVVIIHLSINRDIEKHYQPFITSFGGASGCRIFEVDETIMDKI